MDVLLVTGGMGFLAMLAGAALLEAIGANRIARWLHLPEGNYE